MEFARKKVLVTGAASGIGRATAIGFAAKGAEITIGDRDEAGLAETAAMMALRPRVHIFDAADPASCRELVAAAACNGLDILCNIAGILRWGPSESFALNDFDLVMRVNATSVFILCQAALPHLIERRGNIVNMASVAALQGQAYCAAYVASKHAVAGITKSLAVEFAAQGVRVNAICPGGVRTAMTADVSFPDGVDLTLITRNVPKLPDGLCEPEDIAALIMFLAGERGRKISGSLFTIDGGLLAG